MLTLPMRFRLPAHYLCCAIFQLGFVAGCQTLQGTRPFPVLVNDAETKTPISGAEVVVSYPMSRTSLGPSDSSRTTGNDGVARLWVAPFGDGITLQAAAKGYLPESKDVAVTAIQKIAPAGLFESADDRSANVIIEMYSEPQFTVELIVPIGYRGLVKVDVDLQDDIVCPRNQRSFGYPVSPAGEAKVVGPSLLRRVLPQSYHARYADGTKLDGEMSAAKVGFRWLKQEGKAQFYYVVGTQHEFDRFARELREEEKNSNGSRDAGKGANRSGRHHRGAVAAPD